MSKYPFYIDSDVSVVTELIGGCKKIGDEWILPEGKTLPSQAEIDAKRQELRDDYDSKAYQRERQITYPQLGEQLDLLFHDMTAGKDNKDGEWYKAVAKVKADIPKPTE